MAIVCHSRHLMAAPATFFDFWITSEAEFSVQSRLLIDGSSGGTTQSGLLEPINSVGGIALSANLCRSGDGAIELEYFCLSARFCCE